MHEFLLFHNIIARPELRCCVDWGRSFFARGKTSSSSRLITATTEPVDSLNESSSDMEGMQVGLIFGLSLLMVDLLFILDYNSLWTSASALIYRVNLLLALP